MSEHHTGASPHQIDFKAELNDEQYAAVTAPDGPLLVLAGAGSGKTRTLTYRVAYLLSKNVHPDNILLLTFTNKAAHEMLHRVHHLTGAEPPRFWGGTFHSIGHRILRRFGEAIKLPRNFTILDADESENLLKRTVESLSSTFFKNKTNPRPAPLFGILSLARNTQTSIPDLIDKFYPQHREITHLITPFADAYTNAKRTQNLVDFDDLLELWLQLLQQDPDVLHWHQSRFQHLLVDEYQDTNVLQSQIIDLIAGHHRIMAVGDDAQCIYSWRGADFANIMTFPDRHPGTAIHRIETNYRSTPQILQLANAILEAQPRGRHFEKELRPARPNSEKPYLIETIDDRELAATIVKRIDFLVNENGISPNQIAVLYRSHFLSLEVQLALSKAAVPYTITSGVKFFDRQHIKDLIAFIRFAHNPNDQAAWLRIAALLPKVGEKTALKIHAFAQEKNFFRQTDNEREKRLREINEYREKMRIEELEKQKRIEEKKIERRKRIEEKLKGANNGKPPTVDIQGRAHAPSGGYMSFSQDWDGDEDAVIGTWYAPGEYLPDSEDTLTANDMEIRHGELFKESRNENISTIMRPGDGEQSSLISALSTDDVRSKVPKSAKDEWTSFCASLEEITQSLAEDPPHKTVELATDGWYGDYLRGAFADYIERLDELKALAGFALRFENIEDLLSQIVLLNGETSETQVDPATDAIKLTTIHQAKGLEYDHVFIIGLADGQFPSRRAIESGDIEEERRLFYVASTRAKDALYLCYSKIALRAGPNGMLQSPSRFLQEIPSTLYELVRLKRTLY